MLRIFLLSLLPLLAQFAKAQVPQEVPVYHHDPEKIIFTSVQPNKLLMCAVLPASAGVNSMLLKAFITENGREQEKLISFENKELIHFKAFENSLTLLAYDKKDKANLYLYTMNEQGELSDTLTLPARSKKEEIVATPNMPSSLSWFSLTEGDSLTYYRYTPASGLQVQHIPVQDKSLLNELRQNGAAAFVSQEDFPSIRLASFPLKLFYHEGQFIWIHDNNVYKTIKTKVTIYDPKDGLVNQYTIPVQYEGYIALSSFFLNGQVYRLMRNRKNLQLQSYPLGTAEPGGEFHIAKDYVPDPPLQFSSRYFLKSDYYGNSIAENKYYKRHNRLAYGDLALLVQPLPNGGVQLNAGRYYEDNAPMFINPGSLLVGLIVMAATTTIKSIAHQGKGLEEYFSFNFTDSSLSTLIRQEKLSSLNQFDQAYSAAITEHRRLDYLDYYTINGQHYLGYTTKKERDKLHLIPIDESTLAKGTE